MKSKSIVVTGATGFIGSHLTRTLLEDGEDLLILIRKESDLTRLSDIKDELHLMYYSDFLTSSGPEVEGVIHLSTYYRKFHEYSDIPLMVKTNVVTPSEIVEKAVSSGASFFINTGTFFRYDLSSNILREDSPVLPYNYYSATKVSFENVLDYYCREGLIRPLTLALFSPYGPNDNSNKLIPYIVRNGTNGYPINVTGGKQRLDFTFISDIVEAYRKSIDFLRHNTIHKQEIFNIGTGKNHSVDDVLSYLEEVLGAPLPDIRRDMKSMDTFNVRADTSKASRVLNWSPMVDLKSGIARMVEKQGMKHT